MCEFSLLELSIPRAPTLQTYLPISTAEISAARRVMQGGGGGGGSPDRRDAQLCQA